MQHRILGTTMPVLEIILDRGQSIFAETGEFSWMDDDIQMRTSTSGGGAGGLFGALGRALSGGTLFMTEYASERDGARVAFASHLPSTITPVELDGRAEYMVHKHGFVCATPGVNFSLGLQQRLGAGVFGGTGFVLQKLSGSGQAFVELGGECVVRDLAPGESIRVHPHHVAMFESRVNFDIALIKGFKNAIFGGDGVFQARLTGPGRVWLQSMTISRLAHDVAPYLPQKRD